jgi:hypothetical protein
VKQITKSNQIWAEIGYFESQLISLWAKFPLHCTFVFFPTISGKPPKWELWSFDGHTNILPQWRSPSLYDSLGTMAIILWGQKLKSRFGTCKPQLKLKIACTWMFWTLFDSWEVFFSACEAYDSRNLVPSNIVVVCRSETICFPCGRARTLPFWGFCLCVLRN